jgi:hypothetical protein
MSCLRSPTRRRPCSPSSRPRHRPSAGAPRQAAPHCCAPCWPGSAPGPRSGNATCAPWPRAPPRPRPDACSTSSTSAASYNQMSPINCCRPTSSDRPPPQSPTWTPNAATGTTNASSRPGSTHSRNRWPATCTPGCGSCAAGGAAATNPPATNGSAATSLALPVLRGWAEAGLDLRQITATHIREELARRHGNQARDLHHVLRTFFAALKQERLVFHNPMARISLSTRCGCRSRCPAIGYAGYSTTLTVPALDYWSRSWPSTGFARSRSPPSPRRSRPHQPDHPSPSARAHAHRLPRRTNRRLDQRLADRTPPRLARHHQPAPVRHQPVRPPPGPGRP